MDNINITQIKEDVNLLLFNNFNFGLDDLKKSNKIIDIIGGTANEILKTISSSNSTN